VFQNRVLGRIFGRRRDEVTGASWFVPFAKNNQVEEDGMVEECNRNKGEDERL
jgi:hypothetical protein